MEQKHEGANCEMPPARIGLSLPGPGGFREPPTSKLLDYITKIPNPVSIQRNSISKIQHFLGAQT